MQQYLFAYGTLMMATGIVDVDRAMRAAGNDLGRASVDGRVFDLGAYPGAVPIPSAELTPAGLPAGQDNADAKVWGHLIRLRDPEALFRVIDVYEGFDADAPARSEFVREETMATLSDGARLRAWIYWYRFSTEGREPLASGDYLAHWREQGGPARGRRG